jgi:sugar lactone lactonase YvrE
MKRRGLRGNGFSRAAATSSTLLFALALAPAIALTPVPAAAAAPAKVPAARAASVVGSGTPQLTTYAGEPAAGKPTEVAQQPYGVAVLGRYTFIADPTNQVVRLLLGSSESVFAGNGSLTAEGDGSDLTKSQLKGPYAVAIGHVNQQGFQVVSFDVYIADTFAHQIRKVTVTVPPIDSPNGQLKTQISTVAGSGDFGFSGDGATSTDALLKAQFNSPYGLAWDDSRSILYVADTLNNRIRQIYLPSATPSVSTCQKSGASPAPVPVAPASLLTTVIGAGAALPGPGQVALNHPRGLATDCRGRLYIADTYNNAVRVYDPAAQTLTTFAGTGIAGYSGDGQAASKAQLKQPAGVTLDGQGNVYIADTGNHIVREVGSSGIIQTVAGTPQKGGKSGDGGPATLAQLSSPMGVGVRPNGDVVIADTGNNLVRILEGTLSNGPLHNIHTEAGNGTASFAGDGQPPTQAQFAGPAAVLSQLNPVPLNAAVPAVAGTRYVLDTFNQVVRSYATADPDGDAQAEGDHDADDVATIVGKGGVPGAADVSDSKGADARFADPMGMALDASGKQLYVADTFNNVVRKVDLTTGSVSVFAGTAGISGYSGDNALATKATLSFPSGVAVDKAGDVFIADSYNGVIREVPSGSSNIYTVAGTGALGFSGEGGPATQAGLYFPYGVSVDSASPPDLYISDSFDHRIRRVDAVSPLDPKTGKPMNAAAKNTIETVAGDGAEAFADGAATPPASSSVVAAHFDRPWSLALGQGHLVVADFLNQRLRQVDLTGGTVTTIAGTGSPGLANSAQPPLPPAGPAPDTGPALAGELNGPRGVSMLGDSGALLAADSFNNRVRWLGMTQAGIQRTQVNFDPTNLSGSSQPQSVAVTSTGSGLLVMGKVDVGGTDASNFYLDPSKNTCGQARLEPGGACFFQVAFRPSTPGKKQANVVIPNDAIGGAQTVMLNGQATAALVTLSPPAVAIYQPTTGGAPTPATVTITNNGTGPLNVVSISLDKGTNFSQSNNCPSVMLAQATCQITITMNQIGLTDTLAKADTLVIRDDAAGNPVTTQMVPVTGALAQPATSIDRQALTFTDNIGTSSAPESFRLVNSGQVALHLSEIHEDGDFSQTNTCPPVLAPGAGCVINVIFVPSTLGERDGYIVVADDSADSPHRIAVTGIATIPSAQLGPNRLTFSANVGAATATQMVGLVNRGDGPLTIAGIAATGEFRVQPHCPGVLLPGISCSIGVTFNPAAAGARHGNLIINDDSNALPGSQQSIRLDGIAYQPVASLSLSSLSPSSNLGGSVGQAVNVTNTGDGALTIRGIGISGAASGDFVQSSNCLRTLQPGASCSISVTFAPHGYGARSATLTLYDDGLGGSQSVALHGLGTTPRALLSGSYLNFGGETVGSPSAPQSIVLFNAGNGPLSVSGISETGADYSLTSTCGSTLGAGASCQITVTFLPQGSGPRPGLVVVANSSGTQRFTLSGVGT